jgi:hypothetical protein
MYLSSIESDANAASEELNDFFRIDSNILPIHKENQADKRPKLKVVEKYDMASITKRQV